MQTSLPPLLALLSFALTTQAQEFTCNTTSIQPLPICCGEYYAYNTAAYLSDDPYYYAIFCIPAPEATDGSGDYECGTTAPNTKPACCGSVSPVLKERANRDVDWK